MAAFIRYIDKVTKREVKLEVMQNFSSEAEAREWFDLYIRNAEFREFSPWDELTHGGVRYTVPDQNVRFATSKPSVLAPDPIRKSVLISKRLSQRGLLGRSLLK